MHHYEGHYSYEEVTVTFSYAAEDCLHDLFHHIAATRCNCLLATKNNQELSPRTKIEILKTSEDNPLVVTFRVINYSYEGHCHLQLCCRGLSA